MFKNSIGVYQTADYKVEVKVIFENETVLLNQKQLTLLFGRE